MVLYIFAKWDKVSNTLNLVIVREVEFKCKRKEEVIEEVLRN